MEESLTNTNSVLVQHHMASHKTSSQTIRIRQCVHPNASEAKRLIAQDPSKIYIDQFNRVYGKINVRNTRFELDSSDVDHLWIMLPSRSSIIAPESRQFPAVQERLFLQPYGNRTSSGQFATVDRYPSRIFDHRNVITHHIALRFEQQQ